MGLAGDGKSNFCAWLLGRPAFKMSASTTSETRKVSSVKGNFFNDKSFPAVRIADTPGLADTQKQDASLWEDAVRDLGTHFHNELDLAIWIVNGASSTWTAHRQSMIE